MPPRDQAGLYSPLSSAGVSPDCNRIQPLRSHHAAWSHECGRKCANRVWLVVQCHRGHEDTHTHPQQCPLLLRVWGNFQRVNELERASLGAATWGSLTPGFGGKQDSHTRASTAHSMTEMPTWGQRLHSYSALHRAPDSHIRHSLLLSSFTLTSFPQLPAL